MSEPKKAVIAEIKETEKFYNVITNEGISIGIGKDKNPVLAKQLASAKAGDEFIYTPWEKDGKYYGFDPKSNGAKPGGKSFTPKDKGIEVASSCIIAAAHTHALQKDATPEKVQATAEVYFSWVMGKSTLKS